MDNISRKTVSKRRRISPQNVRGSSRCRLAFDGNSNAVCRMVMNLDGYAFEIGEMG